MSASMILITGGAGFIGINFVQLLKRKLDASEKIIILDKLTYASNLGALDTLKGIDFKVVDIANLTSLKNVFDSFPISTIINFAAETFVDSSIKDCSLFVDTNIIGTINLLKMCVEYKVAKFIQISTDEVFGQVLHPDSFNETSSLDPRNPYAASKASAELFVSAFRHTYNVPAIVVNCSNNYGPYQHTEKFIPKIITNLLNGKRVPVYGNGCQIRDWIYVEDCCEAIYAILKNANVGERYCVGGNNLISNIDLVRLIANEMDLKEDMIDFVTDRPGHDFRYHLDTSKIESDLGWSPKVKFRDGIKRTIRHYYENRI